MDLPDQPVGGIRKPIINVPVSGENDSGISLMPGRIHRDERHGPIETPPVTCHGPVATQAKAIQGAPLRAIKTAAPRQMEPIAGHRFVSPSRTKRAQSAPMKAAE